MRKLNFFTKTSLAVFIFLHAQSGLLCALEDAIVAVVNDEIITYHDLRDYLENQYVQLRLEGMAEEEIKQAMANLESKGLDLLIEDKLIKQKAIQLGLIVREPSINERVQDIKKKYKNDENFMLALTSNGYTLTDLKDKVREQLLATYVIDSEIRSKILVSPQEVTEYYNQHKGTLTTREKIKVDSICVSFTSDKVNAKQKIDEAYKLLNDGKNFPEISRQYSNITPITGVLEKGQLLPSIENKIFNLNVNEISLVIEAEKAFYIFKILDKVPAAIPSLEDIKSNIYDRIFQEKFRKNYLAFIEKLKKDAYVEIKK